MGKLIVIEGLDGTGKHTQATLLTEELQQEYGMSHVRQVSFPNYDSDASALVKMYLRGDFGAKPNDVNAYAASAFYAVDRYASYKTDWGQFYRDGGIIVADRYTTSNAIHQCAKLPNNRWPEYLDWLTTFEYYKLGLPEPDAVIYLAADPAVSQKLISQRYHGDETKKDIHERDIEYLNRANEAAAYCADVLQWHSVECITEKDGDKVMRTPQDIHKEIARIVSNIPE